MVLNGNVHVLFLGMLSGIYAESLATITGRQQAGAPGIVGLSPDNFHQFPSSCGLSD